MKPQLYVLTLLFASLGLLPRARAELFTFPERPVDSRLAAFRNAVKQLHAKAVRSKKPWTEKELQQKIQRRYLDLDQRYAKLKDPTKKAQALAQLALVFAELSWVERIRPIAEKLTALDKKLAYQLGYFAESEHFLVRVVGADPKWGEAALKLGEAARAGYLRLFGFPAISKVPGKKIRILIHVDPALARDRLYAHPTPLYHSELRYEMADARLLTLSGKRRVVYGVCHELGHMVAMWGKYREVEDDKHAWAHYTGCLVVEEVYERLGDEPWPTWTSYQRRASGVARLLKQIEGHESGLDSYESILVLFHAVGEEFGTEVYGRAWEWLEKRKRFRRINNMPYLWLKDLKEALLEVAPRDKRRRVDQIFNDG